MTSQHLSQPMRSHDLQQTPYSSYSAVILAPVYQVWKQHLVVRPHLRHIVPFASTRQILLCQRQRQDFTLTQARLCPSFSHLPPASFCLIPVIYQHVPVVSSVSMSSATLVMGDALIVGVVTSNLAHHPSLCQFNSTSGVILYLACLTEIFEKLAAP